MTDKTVLAKTKKFQGSGKCMQARCVQSCRFKTHMAFVVYNDELKARLFSFVYVTVFQLNLQIFRKI